MPVWFIVDTEDEETPIAVLDGLTWDMGDAETVERNTHFIVDALNAYKGAK
jgi:hypothetical protein